MNNGFITNFGMIQSSTPKNLIHFAFPRKKNRPFSTNQLKHTCNYIELLNTQQKLGIRFKSTFSLALNSGIQWTNDSEA